MDTIHRTTGARLVEASSVQVAGRASGMPVPLSALLDLVLCWMDRVRQRRALQQLSDPLLKDIGLTRADVELETSKWFWQI